MSSSPHLIKNTLTIASLFALRMIGLFMFIPIFSLYAGKLTHATPLLIGISFGIYGLSQALFQIPLGLLSDRIGRKPVLMAGFFIFALASILGAYVSNIYLMMACRFLQGSAAIGSTLIALLSDLTDDEHRTRAMALIGMSIGLSFFIAILFGPILAAQFNLSGVFMLSGLLAFVAIAILQTQVPNIKPIPATDKPSIKTIQALLAEKNLRLFDIGIFVQHAIFTASFFALPLLLKHTIKHQWHVYLPILVISFLTAYPLIAMAEKKRQLKPLYLSAILITSLSQLWLWHSYQSVNLLCVALFFFFSAFNALEATLPASISKVAPKDKRGTAMGIYSSSQFLGIFFGGFMAGHIASITALHHVFLFNSLLGLTWYLVSRNISIPSRSETSHVNEDAYNETSTRSEQH